jgi:acylphosphatase
MQRIRRAVAVHGVVQGVGFRYFALRVAARHNLTGWVANHPDGTVRLEAEGDPASIDAFLASIRQGPTGGLVSRLEVVEIPIVNDRDFQVVSWR